MVVISANAVQAAPIGLAATISTAATIAGTAIATTATATATKTIAMTTLQKTLVTATVTILAGAGIYEAHQGSQLREQVKLLQKQQAPLVEQIQLLQNERDEWELPGGKLELGESPEDCVRREIHEELGLHVTTGPLLDSWVYHITAGVDVLIVTYGCFPAPFSAVTHSPEHQAVGLFTVEEVQTLPMPQGYKKSIQAWAERLAVSPAQ